MTDPIPAASPADTAPVAETTILVVDDSPEHLHHIGGLLAEHYHVRIASSGTMAIDIAASAPQPALILLDVEMPDLDGFATLARLRASPATRDIPVIFVTGDDDAGDEQRGLDLGAVDYITKPPYPAIFLARIRTQIELHRSRRA
jgi:putative two-component system response regulator